MAGIPIYKSSKAVTAATAGGVLTVDETASLFPGTTAWLTKNDASASVHVKILSILTATTLKVGNADPVVGANGFSSQTNNPIDVSAYNSGSTLCIETSLRSTPPTRAAPASKPYHSEKSVRVFFLPQAQCTAAISPSPVGVKL